MKKLDVKLNTVEIRRRKGYPFLYGRKPPVPNPEDYNTAKLLCGGVETTTLERLWWYTREYLIDPSGKIAENHWILDDSASLVAKVRVDDVVTITGRYKQSRDNKHGKCLNHVKLLAFYREGENWKAKATMNTELERCPTCGQEIARET